jgi:hypothetical protein
MKIIYKQIQNHIQTNTNKYKYIKIDLMYKNTYS